MKRFLLKYIFPYIAYFFIYLHCWTIRERNKNQAGEDWFLNLEGNYILSLWHGHIYYLLYHYRGHADYVLLISPSDDGELLARVASLLGYSVIRGSTYKNAKAAARSLIKVLRRGGRIIVVADGSRGPRYQAQPGCIQLARATGAPVIPMTYDADRKVTLGSWDRFIIPLPFTRCTLNFGQPIHVPREAGDAQVEAHRQEMESTLRRITAECVK